MAFANGLQQQLLPLGVQFGQDIVEQQQGRHPDRALQLPERLWRHLALEEFFCQVRQVTTFVEVNPCLDEYSSRVPGAPHAENPGLLRVGGSEHL